MQYNIFFRVICYCAVFFSVLLNQSHIRSANTLRVTKTSDTSDNVCDTDCSFREAITVANATIGTDYVEFAIPGTGIHSITLLSALPVIVDPISIDGTTQAGYTGLPVIEIVGNSAGFPVNGLWLQTAGSTIRGLSINGFSGAGILVFQGGNNLISRNFIGVRPDGSANGNRDGVYIYFSSNNTIGGSESAERNLISANNDDGVNLEGAGSTGNRIEGNWIGTNISGLSSLGNLGDGVKIGTQSNGNIFRSNTIAFNKLRGIFVSSDGPPINNQIARNSIYNNSGLGVDLGGDGVSGNDNLDSDLGPNGLINYPVISMFEETVSGATVIGYLHGSPSKEFQIDFFANLICDKNGYGEGERYIGSIMVTTNSSGDADFVANLQLLNPNLSISAVTIDSSGNTSEFSKCISENKIAPTLNDISGNPITLTWNSVSNVHGYSVRIALDEQFTQIVHSNDALPADQLWFSLSLPPGRYYWQVRTRLETSQYGAWSTRQVLAVLDS